MLLRFVGRIAVSRWFIAIVELLMIGPMTLGVLEVSRVVWVKPDLAEAMSIVNGIGLIMIGQGVVLEERHALRSIFRLLEEPNQEWQHTIDESCHYAGVGVLVFGLVAEICIELVHIPNTVIYTGDYDDWLVALGALFVVGGALIFLRHAFVLLFQSAPPKTEAA